MHSYKSGAVSELFAEVDEPVQPSRRRTREDSAAEGDEHADAAFGSEVVVAGAGGDGPDDRGDEDHEHGDDQGGHEQGTGDLHEVTNAAHTLEVGKDIHAFQVHARRPDQAQAITRADGTVTLILRGPRYGAGLRCVLLRGSRGCGGSEPTDDSSRH